MSSEDCGDKAQGAAHEGWATTGSCAERARKRQRVADEAQLSEELMEEWACPISGTLPVDPVTAKDGRVYERRDLALWFEKNPGATVKSPVTGEPMGKDVTTAYQVKNSIKHLVDRKLLRGAAVDAWKAASAEMDGFSTELKEHFIKAARGDALAMVAIGFAYREGRHGAAVNHERSVEWMQKAASKDSVQAWASLGMAYMQGKGVAIDRRAGIMYLTQAAALGSEHGCCALGYYLYRGTLVKQDIPMARYWYRKSLKTGMFKDAVGLSVTRRSAFFKEHGE
jgi:TPR repeat protein